MIFSQITTFIKVRVAFVFGCKTFLWIEFTKIYQLKGLKPKNNGHINFYERCDLIKISIYLENTVLSIWDKAVHVTK